MTCLVCVLLGAAPAPTEGAQVAVQLKDGSRKEGKVLHDTPTGFLLKTSAGIETIAFDQVTRLDTLTLASPPPAASAPERRATIVSIDGKSVTGAMSEVPGGFAVQTATGKVVVSFEKVREVKDLPPAPAAPAPPPAPPAPPERRATVVSIDGKSVTGAISEVPGGFAVQTSTGKVVVPFEKVREVRDLPAGPAPAPAASPAPASPPPARPVEPVNRAPLPAGSAAPRTEPAPEAEATRAEPEPQPEPAAAEGARRVFVGASLSGVVVPPFSSGNATWALGGDVDVMIAFSRRWDLVVLGNFTHAEDDNTGTNAALLGVGAEVWFGVYGLGAVTGLGYAKFDNKSGHGWGDDSASILVLGSPARFRFGEQVQHHFFLDLGTIVFLSHEPRIFGRIGYAFYF